MAAPLRPAAQRWCHDLPAATAQIECGGHQHRITWRRGKLVLEDHDVLAERSLVALGSEPPTCVQVLDAWRRVRGTDVLYEFLRGDGRTTSASQLADFKRFYEQEMAPPENPPMRMPPQAQIDFERRLAQRRERAKRMWEVTLIDALPEPLRRAMALSVLVTIARRWHDEEYRRTHGGRLESALLAVVDPLFERSVRHWRRNLRPEASVVIDLRLLAPGEQPSCDATAHTVRMSAVLSLPVDWFVDVWAHDLAVVDGCFVLGRTRRAHEGTAVPVLAVRWQRQAPGSSRAITAPAVVTRADDDNPSLRWV